MLKSFHPLSAASQVEALSVGHFHGYSGAFQEVV